MAKTPVTGLPASTPMALQSILHPADRMFLLNTSCHSPVFNLLVAPISYPALHKPALSNPVPSLTVTLPSDAKDFLLLLQQEQPVSTPGSLHMHLPLPGSFSHSI